jgi:hypothetical protein
LAALTPSLAHTTPIQTTTTSSQYAAAASLAVAASLGVYYSLAAARAPAEAPTPPNPPPGKKAELFISYAWGSDKPKQRARELARAISDKTGLLCWLDIEKMGASEGGVSSAMADGIADATVFVACISRAYAESENCSKELAHAQKLKKTVLFVNVDDGLNPFAPAEAKSLNSLSFEIGKSYVYDLTRGVAASESAPELDKLLGAIQSRVPTPGSLASSQLRELVCDLARANQAAPPPPAAPRPEALPAQFDPRAAFHRAQRENPTFVRDECCACSNYGPKGGALGKWLVFGSNPGEARVDIDALWRAVQGEVQDRAFPGATPIYFAKVSRKDPGNPCLMVFAEEGPSREGARQWLVGMGVAAGALPDSRWKREIATASFVYSPEDPLKRGPPGAP